MGSPSFFWFWLPNNSEKGLHAWKQNVLLDQDGSLDMQTMGLAACIEIFSFHVHIIDWDILSMYSCTKPQDIQIQSFVLLQGSFLILFKRYFFWSIFLPKPENRNVGENICLGQTSLPIPSKSRVFSRLVFCFWWPNSSEIWPYG